MRPGSPPPPAPVGAGRPGRSVWHRIGVQLARPEGGAGMLAGWLMAQLNRTPNRLAIDALSVRPRERVLEIGFGPGAGLAELARRAPGARICGLDASGTMLRLAGRLNAGAIATGRMELTAGDFSRLPWEDGSFDKVLAVNVAYFFDRDGVAAGEIRRVLAPGGWAAFYVTDRATMARWPFAGPETHSTYDREDLLQLLRAGGFAVPGIAIRSVELPMGIKGLIATASAPNSTK